MLEYQVSGADPGLGVIDEHLYIFKKLYENLFQGDSSPLLDPPLVVVSIGLEVIS